MNNTGATNSTEKVLFTDDLSILALLTQQEKIIETGISFSGAVKVDESISIITNKDVKIPGNIMDAKKTYLKVMEMRELTEEEQKYASKGREFLAKMFKIMFYNKKAMIAWTCTVAAMLGLDIATGNLLGIAINIILILLFNRPIKFIKEIAAMYEREDRIEELSEELRENHLLSLIDSVDNDKDIKMYAKLKQGR
ncbi:MAG TPA: hypothetical protein DCE23_05980 [Firmicutes bacterium]|nr:hypothetical protein [Bacillota bacterium]